MKAIMENWRRYNQSENLVILMKTRDDLLREAEEAEQKISTAVVKADKYYTNELVVIQQASDQLQAMFGNVPDEKLDKMMKMILMQATDVPIDQWKDPDNPARLRPEVQADFEKLLQRATGVVDGYSRSLQNPEYSPVGAGMLALSSVVGHGAGLPLTVGIWKLFMNSTPPKIDITQMEYHTERIAQFQVPTALPSLTDLATKGYKAFQGLPKKDINIDKPVIDQLPSFDIVAPVLDGTEWLWCAFSLAIAWYVIKTLGNTISQFAKRKANLQRDSKETAKLLKQAARVGISALSKIVNVLKKLHEKLKVGWAAIKRKMQARKAAANDSGNSKEKTPKSSQKLRPPPPVVKQGKSGEDSLKEEIRQLKEILDYFKGNQSLAHIGGVL